MLRAIQDAYGHAIALEYEGGRLSRIVDTAGREIRVQNDAHGRVTRLEVWAAPPAPPPDPARPTAPEPMPSLELWFDYAYHPTGKLASATNALGHADRYAYDALHRMVKTTLKNGVSFYYLYDDESGWCIRTWGDGGLHTVDLKPDFKKKTTHTSGKTEPRIYTWNDDGLVLREETLDGSFVREREYDADHYLLSEVNAAGEKTEYAYDARGNRIEIVDPAGNETLVAYIDDLPVKRVAPDGLTTTYAHDGHGALMGVTYASGLAYRLAYDRDGHLAEISGPDGLIYSARRDSRHDIVQEIDARGARTTYVHDALGRPLVRCDALGKLDTRRVRSSRSPDCGPPPRRDRDARRVRRAREGPPLHGRPRAHVQDDARRDGCPRRSRAGGRAGMALLIRRERAAATDQESASRNVPSSNTTPPAESSASVPSTGV